MDLGRGRRLGDSLDVAQRHYFEAVVAKQVQPGDKIIIVLHAPDWFKRRYKALTMICQLAREKGEVCALLAGDLHHYSRYESDGSRTQAAPHHVRRRRRLCPPDARSEGDEFACARGGRKDPVQGRATRRDLARRTALPGAPVGRARSRDTDGLIGFSASGNQFYPTKRLSRMLALKNIFLPLHNLRFALFLGVVYMVYAWVFQIAVADPTVAIKQAQNVSIEMQCRTDNPDNEALARGCVEKEDIDPRQEAVGVDRPG